MSPKRRFPSAYNTTKQSPKNFIGISKQLNEDSEAILNVKVQIDEKSQPKMMINEMSKMGEIYKSTSKIKGPLSRQRHISNNVEQFTGFGESGIVTKSFAGKIIKDVM